MGARVRLGKHRSEANQTLYFAIRVLSARCPVRDSTHSGHQLVSCLAMSSPAKRNLDIDAPLSARNVAMFWLRGKPRHPTNRSLLPHWLRRRFLRLLYRH